MFAHYMVYVINIDPFYDSARQCYTHIYTVDRPPDPPLASITRRVAPPRLSPFRPACAPCGNTQRCQIALCDPGSPGNLLRPGQEALLFTYLAEHGYEIDSTVTKALTRSPVEARRILCAIAKRLPNN